MNTKYLLVLLMWFIIPWAYTQNIVSGEYFFDTAPLPGSGTTFSVTASADVTHQMTIPTTSLNAGFHNLFIRVKNDLNVWSPYEGRMLYILEPTALQYPDIVAGEWFIDTDPGLGNGTSFSVTSDSIVTSTLTIPNTLSPGFHNLFVRVKNDEAKWSHYEGRMFYVLENQSLLTATIVSGEWFINSDPGTGNGTAFSLSPSSTIQTSLAIATNSLPAGFNNLFIRVKNDLGQWSPYEGRMFYILDEEFIANKQITSGEWFVDADPGIGNGTDINFPSADTINPLIDINALGLDAGKHHLFIRVKDAANKWSLYEGREFTVCDDMLATPTILGDNQLCNGETLTLDAGNITGALSYLWKGPNGFTATSQTINISNVTALHEGTYSVVAVRGNTTCDTSNISSVLVMVNSIPNLTITDPSAVCDPLTVDITAAFIDNNNVPGNVAYFTDADATNVLPNPQAVAVSGTYYIKKTSDIGLCSDMKPVMVTINSKTTSLVTETACESFTLNGVTYTSSDVYTQTLTNAAGCDSILTLNLKIKEPTTATITETACERFTLNGVTYTSSDVYTQTLTNAAGCDSVITLNLTINTVDASVVATENTLTANAAGASYQWIDCNNSNASIAGETSQSFTIASSGNYAVIVTENGCSATSICTQMEFVGVPELATKNGIVVYPNPATDLITVKAAPDLLGFTYRIISPIGKIILIGKVTEETITIDLKAYPAGVYLIKVGEQNQQPFKVVKK